MGYNTWFTGKFVLDKPLSVDHFKELVEFIADTHEDNGYIHEEYENLPRYKCHWKIKSDRQTIVWDKTGKFKCFIEWIQFLIGKFFEPWQNEVNGEVSWQGDHFESDTGIIQIKNNVVTETDLQELRDKAEKQNDVLSKKLAELEKYVLYLEEHIRCMPDGDLALSAKADFVKLCA